MARPPKNSAKLPILLALLHTSGPLVIPVTSRDVIAFLETVGAGLNPRAVRMNLKRYAERGVVSRSRIEDAQLHEPLYLYQPNDRTRGTVAFLASQSGGLTDSELALLLHEEEMNAMREDLKHQKDETRFYQDALMMYWSMKNNAAMAGGASQASWAQGATENRSFRVEFREPMYRDGRKVTYQDGRPAYRKTVTYATWGVDGLVLFTQPSNPDEAEIWNGVEWEPLRPKEGAVTHRLTGLEPIMDDGKAELDELGQAKYRPTTAEYVYRGKSWEPLRHGRMRRSKRLHPASKSGPSEPD
ncbi:MAG: hypothetical protein JRN59_06625 [Nitrososphaerota archaeon]|nr:hypothetical protein [Nitrososphaerota archaeon]